MKIKKLLTITCLFLFFCSNAQSNNPKVNSIVNKEFLESQQSMYGKLNAEDLVAIREMISKELNTKLSSDKAILINYHQFGSHCRENGIKPKEASKIIDRTIKISADVSKKYNLLDFFVYTNDYFNKESVSKRNNFILDNGFFQKSIFTIQDHCCAFFILKTNGDFMKYYGPDYHGKILKFMTTEIYK